MKKNSVLTKAFAGILATAMAFGAFAGFGKMAQATSTRSTYQVGTHANINTGADGSVGLDKYAYLNQDGSYTVQLSAFATGDFEVQTVSEQRGIDIVFVIDQSGSMRDEQFTMFGQDFNMQHLSAAKNAVGNFINKLVEQDLDHRVAIVGYSNGNDENDTAQVYYDEDPEMFASYGSYRFKGTGLFVDGNFYRYHEEELDDMPIGSTSDDKATRVISGSNDPIYADALMDVQNDLSGITDSVDALNAYEGTFMSYGLEMAKNIIDAREDQTRPAVIIAFTDGMVGNTGFSMSEAARCVNIATDIKFAGTKVFTVGMVANEFYNLYNAIPMGGSSNFETFGRLLPGYSMWPASLNTDNFEAAANTKLFDSYYDNSTPTSTWYGMQDFSGTTGSLVDTNLSGVRNVYNQSYYYMGGNYTATAIPKQQAQYQNLGLEEGFLARDLLALVSSEYPCTEETGPNGKVYAELGDRAALYNHFVSALDNGNKIDGYYGLPSDEFGTTGNGYLWPIWNARSTGVEVQHSRLYNLSKCVAYYQKDNSGVDQLVAGDYYFAMVDAVKNNVNRDYYNKVADKTNSADCKYYIKAIDSTDGGSLTNMEALDAAFDDIQEVVSSEIVGGVAGGGALGANTAIVDKLSDNFKFDASNVSVEFYTQPFMGIEGGEYVFGDSQNATGMNYTIEGKTFSANGFDFSANACYTDPVSGDPVGSRIIIVINGVLAEETASGNNLATNDATSGLYQPGEGTATGTPFVPSENDQPAQFPTGSELVFPVPTVNIREHLIVYDWSTSIVAGLAASNGDAMVYTLAEPFVKVDQTINKLELSDLDITLHASALNTVCVDIKAIDNETRTVGALINTGAQTETMLGDVGLVEWVRIDVVPATNVHYEETLINFVNGVADWSTEGTPVGTVYDVTNDTLVAAGLRTTQDGRNYCYGNGSDEFSYSSYGLAADSNGTSKTVHVGKAERAAVNAGEGQWPSMNFSFTGTGVDIMGRTGMNSGVYVVTVTDSSNTKVDTRIINTRYYGNDGGADVLYQVPVYRATDLDYDTYTVNVQFVWMPGYAKDGIIPGIDTTGYTFENLYEQPATRAVPENLPEFDVYVDAIRVYNPVDTDTDTIAKATYAAINELNPDYKEIRNFLMADGADLTAGGNASGGIYIDVTPHLVPVLDEEGNPVIGADGKPVWDFAMPQGDFTASDYKDYGPNNEMYLKTGNAFGFELLNAKNVDTLHMSAKIPFVDSGATSVTMTASVFADSTKVGEKNYTIDSSTEMYYDFSELLDDARIESASHVYVVISANGDGILSICGIKTVTADGSALNIVANQNAVEASYAALVGTKGDVNADGKVSVIDALNALRAAMNLDELGTFGSYCADYNCDGSVTVLDAVEIIRAAIK